MSCSCIKGHYDFSLEVLDTTKFRYTDLSMWMEDENYVIPDKQPIEVTLPSGKKVTIYVKPKDSVVITAKDLGFSSCLEDGIYCFTTKECKNCTDGEWGGRKYSKTESIMPRMLCKIQSIVATEDDEDKSIKLYSDYRLIQIVAAGGQDKKSAELYRVLNKEVSRYNCKSCDC